MYRGYQGKGGGYFKFLIDLSKNMNLYGWASLNSQEWPISLSPVQIPGMLYAHKYQKFVISLPKTYNNSMRLSNKDDKKHFNLRWP